MYKTLLKKIKIIGLLFLAFGMHCLQAIEKDILVKLIEACRSNNVSRHNEIYANNKTIIGQALTKIVEDNLTLAYGGRPPFKINYRGK